MKKEFKVGSLLMAMCVMFFTSCEEKEVGAIMKKEGVSGCLCFMAVDDAVSIGTGGTFPADVEYSVDSGRTWTGVSGLATTPVPLAAGEKMYFRATKLLTKFNSEETKGRFTTDGAGKLKVSGNIMSLMDPAMQVTGFNATDGQYAFFCLFKGCTNLTDISELSLPATTLAESCYSEMFNGCTGLIAIPGNLLPAPTLAGNCYSGMFNNCTELTEVPEKLLPATTLAVYCYSEMFYGCRGLKTIPEKLLPATTLAGGCYNSMFYGCRGLKTIPEKLLPATTLAMSCYNSMFYGCTKLTEVPEKLLPAPTLAGSCYSGMFSGCTGLTEVPDGLLPAKALAGACYENMFSDCTELTNVPDGLLPVGELQHDFCYSEMFSGCSKLATAPKLPAQSLKPYCYNRMFYGCSSLAEVTCLAEELTAANALTEWLEGTADDGTLHCATGMESNWSSYLPAGWNVSAD